MRDQHRSPGRDEPQQRLFLEREPGATAEADALDEIVPEFMHRGFYRSQEGEIDAVEAVEPSGLLRAVRTESGGFRATSLRGPVRPPEPEQRVLPDEPLRPVRSALVPDSGGEVETESETEHREPQPVRSPSPLPRPGETGGINLPLLLCLFFVVGLFMWREGTRPVVSPDLTTPVPRRLRVGDRVQVTQPQQTLGESNPQPVTSPSLPAAAPEEGDTSVAKVAPEERTPEQDELFPPEGEEAVAGASEDPLPAEPEGSAAQRAAILERMSAGTVDRNDRERRMEGDLQDTSLFPATKPQPRPQSTQPVAAKAPPKKPAEVIAEPGTDLFPGANAGGGPASERLPAQAPPPGTPSGTSGKPKYQIAEPQL